MTQAPRKTHTINTADILLVHIPKTAGTTIRRAQAFDGVINVPRRPFYTHDYIKAQRKSLNTIRDKMGYEHGRYRDLIRISHYKKIVAVIRNPWDRVASRYLFAKKLIQVDQQSFWYGRNDYATVGSFEGFLEDRWRYKDFDYAWHRPIIGWNDQLDYVDDGNGNIKCDLLRFEKFNEEIFRYTGVPVNSIPRLNSNTLNTIHYSKLYNNKTIQMVADWHQRDIETFGFDFDTGATNNVLYRNI